MREPKPLTHGGAKMAIAVTLSYVLAALIGAVVVVTDKGIFHSDATAYTMSGLFLVIAGLLAHLSLRLYRECVMKRSG